MRVCTLVFRHNAIARSVDYSSVNRTLTGPGKRSLCEAGLGANVRGTSKVWQDRQCKQPLP